MDMPNLEKIVEIDSSDEEDNINTVGDIPMEYYKDHDHIGYDTNGRPIIKPDVKSAIEQFLEKKDNCIRDPKTGQSIVVSQEDCKLIRNLISGKSSVPRNQPDDLVFPEEIMETPVTCVPPSKKTFIPPKDEQIKVSKLVHAIKMGFKPMPKPQTEDEEDDDECLLLDDNAFTEEKKVFKHLTDENLQWLDKSVLNNKTKHQLNRKIIDVHTEYPYSNKDALNPPPEYLLNEEEIKKQKKKFYSRDYNPFRHKNELPQIPGNIYNLDQVLVAFEKQARDLLYGRRYVKKQVNTTSEQLLKIHNPTVNKDVKPYPNMIGGSVNVEEIILDIAVYESFVAVVSYESLKIYYDTKVVRKYPVKIKNREEVTLRNPLIYWIPNSYLIAVAVDNVLKIINPCFENSDPEELETKMEEWYKNRHNSTNNENGEEEPKSKKVKSLVDWNFVRYNDEGNYTKQLSYLEVIHNQTVIDMDWNKLGHFVTIAGKNRGTSSRGELFIHNLSNCNSYLFGKDSEYHISRFSPVQSHKFYVLVSVANATNSMSINVIDIKQKKKVMTAEVLGSACSMELSPLESDIMAVGSFEGKLYLYNLELSARPFKVLDVRQSAIRSISFSSKYPLFNVCTANGSVIVFHMSPSDDDVDPESLEKEHYVKSVHQFKHLEKPGELYQTRFEHDKCSIVTGGSSGLLYSLVSSH